MEILDPEMHRALDEDDFMDPEKLDDGCEEYEFQNGDYDEFNFTIAKDSKITKA